jgi:tetratricopeptide (TPR) repeat protein
VTSRIHADRIRRQLDKAEGYLMLKMPRHALQILQKRSDWATMQFEASFLSGEALRALGQFREALKPLEVAAALRPDSVDVALALGWCYKRTHRLAQAIDALQRASQHNPDDHPLKPLIHYNLACYWSLAGDSAKAIDELTEALVLEPELRSRLADESDFDRIRNHPEFARLTGDPKGDRQEKGDITLY